MIIDRSISGRPMTTNDVATFSDSISCNVGFGKTTIVRWAVQKLKPMSTWANLRDSRIVNIDVQI